MPRVRWRTVNQYKFGRRRSKATGGRNKEVTVSDGDVATSLGATARPLPLALHPSTSRLDSAEVRSTPPTADSSAAPTADTSAATSPALEAISTPSTSTRTAAPSPALTVNPRPSRSSASTRKLSYYESASQVASEGANSSAATVSNNSFCFAQLSCLNDLIQPMLCPKCRKPTLKVTFEKSVGLSVLLAVTCFFCPFSNKVHSSERISDGKETNKSRLPFEVNRRAVLAAKEVAVGSQGLQKICSVLNVEGGLHHKTFQDHSTVIQSRVLDGTLHTTLEQARQVVREIHGVSDSKDVVDIAVSYDGSWHKRGYTSNYGVGCVIEVESGLVIDFAILSKYCSECELTGKKLQGEELQVWQEVHAPVCDRSWGGSSPAMEPEIAKLLWSRSVSHGFRYTTMVSDGDSKTFTSLQALKPYGPDFPILKEECVNHVAKRLYSGLEKLAGEQKALGVQMKGKGRLSKARMLRWQGYYRNAIVNNPGDVKKATDDIWAILFHSLSSGDSQHHSRCQDSWCYYKIAQRDGLDPEVVRKKMEHDDPLPTEVGDHLVPLFKRLTDPDLLQKCSSLKTQNANESLHASIWRKIPKTQFVGLKTLECGVAMGVCQFNRGASTLASCMADAGVPGGETAAVLIRRLDQARKRKSEGDNSSTRTKKKVQKTRREEDRKKAEGPSYASGSF